MSPLRLLQICRPILFVVLLAFSPLAAQCQDKPNPPDDPGRRHALELFDQFKMVEAMPLLEKLAADHPKDVVVWERWGVATLHYSQTIPDPELRRKARVRARTILLKAKELGDNSNLLQTLLAMVPEDGGEVAFSGRQEVNDAMQQAEADFARGDLDKAREGYLRALLLDPNLYEAALFTGDAFFKQQQPGFAGAWFDRAIQIDPNRETAYRYWGDSLISEGKMDEARSKFIEAVIADPYNQTAWMGLSQWADRNGVKLTFLRLRDKSSVSVNGDKTNITIDPSSLGKDDPSTSAWLIYGMDRALWQREKFKKEFPGETQYRHTLREEADCLHSMVGVLSETSSKNGKRVMDPELSTLLQIDKAGASRAVCFSEPGRRGNCERLCRLPRRQSRQAAPLPGRICGTQDPATAQSG